MVFDGIEITANSRIPKCKKGRIHEWNRDAFSVKLQSKQDVETIRISQIQIEIYLFRTSFQQHVDVQSVLEVVMHLYDVYVIQLLVNHDFPSDLAEKTNNTHQVTRLSVTQCAFT